MKRPGSLPGGRLPRDARCIAAINLLVSRGADRTRHANGRSLLQHLLGTAQLLLQWNAPIDTVRAGLCHSIYGTNAFKTASLAAHERALLQRTIGRRAEGMVWRFASLRRPATLLHAVRYAERIVRLRSGRTRQLPTAELHQLFFLECANLLDQGLSFERGRELHALASQLRESPPNMLTTLDLQLRRARFARADDGMQAPGTEEPASV